MSRRPRNWLAAALVLGLAGVTGAGLWRSANHQGPSQGGPNEDTSGSQSGKKTSGATIDPKDRPEISVFLIGDAGAPAQQHEPVLAALEKALSEDPQRSAVVFLGDNIYPDGMPDSLGIGRKEAERRLDAQLQTIKGSKARGILIPGNHDWGGITGRDGFNAMVREGAYIAASGSPAVMLPQAGCPGPAVQDVGTNLRLVILDTQWWLRRSGPSNSARKTVPCAFVSQKTVLDSLKFLMKNSPGRRIILMSHHPIASQGEHGGFFGDEDNAFPLAGSKKWLRVPLAMVGSAYIAARRMGLSEQDLTSPKYASLIRQIMSTFTKDEPFIYAAGHDHDLQVMAFEEAPKFVLVSGTGIYGHTSAVQTTAPARFAKSESGYMRVRAWADGRIRLTVFTIDQKAQVTEAFDEWIAQGQPRKMAAKNAD
jgi:hypothetical protein